MDYRCGKFDDCSFSRFGLSRGQVESQTRMNALPRGFRQRE